MAKQDVMAHANPQAATGCAKRKVEVVQVETVERVAVESQPLGRLSPRGEERAIQRLQASRHWLGKAQQVKPCTNACRMRLNDPAASEGPSAPAPCSPSQAGRANHAHKIHAIEGMTKRSAKTNRQHPHVVVTEYNDLAMSLLQTPLVPLGKRSRVGNPNELATVGLEGPLERAPSRSEAIVVSTADDNRHRACGIGRAGDHWQKALGMSAKYGDQRRGEEVFSREGPPTQRKRASTPVDLPCTEAIQRLLAKGLGLARDSHARQYLTLRPFCEA